MTEQPNLDPLHESSPMDGVGEPSGEAPRVQSGGHPLRQTAPAPTRLIETERHFLDHIKVLYKRRYLAGTTFILVLGAVTVYTFTATPIFQARTRVLIEVENPNIVSFKEVINEQQTKADYYLTQYNILQSRSLARKTLDSLKLWTNPILVGDSGRPSGWVSSATAWVKGLFGSETESVENRIPGADETRAQSRAIDAFLVNLTISPIRNSRLVDIRYDSPDPQLATLVANSIATNYIDQTLEYKFLASKEATDWLSDRLSDQRKKVQEAEEALQKYREQNEAISLEDRQNIVVQKLGDLNAAVTRAKTARIEKEALYNQLRLSQDNPALVDTFPAILVNSFVQQLKGQLADLQRQRAQLAERLLDEHPEMIKVNSAIQNTQAKLDAEIKKVVQSVKSEYDSALSQEQSLTTALNQQRGEALSMNKKSIEYGVLDRDAQSNKQIYDSLMQRAKETGVSGELRTSNIRVVDPAEKPRRPISPNRLLNELAALFGGGLLAVTLAFFFEYIDSRIKSPDEIKAHLGIPHLGMLPLVPRSDGSPEYTLVDGSVAVNFSEAFRVLRTNVLFSSAAGGGQCLLVTSTGPGEGKSLVAANLGVSLAQAGRRVLLIDADLRKPKVHSVFNVKQEPGLSNVLVGNAKASECVKKASVPGLWILPAGRIPPNPAELLGSDRFRDFIGSLTTHFDFVIMDSPPVMAVADASVIAHLATGVLFVIGAEMTSRHAARRAVEQIETARGIFFGAVLNRVDLERNAYYYSQYYRREYTTYYTKQ